VNNTNGSDDVVAGIFCTDAEISGENETGGIEVPKSAFFHALATAILCFKTPLEGSHSREQKPSKHCSDIPSIQRDDSYSMHSVLSESSASSGE
jgi:hypothetical protein